MITEEFHATVNELALRARWTGDAEALERLVEELFAIGRSVSASMFPVLHARQDALGLRDEINHAITIAAWKTAQYYDGERNAGTLFHTIVRSELQEVIRHHFGHRKFDKDHVKDRVSLSAPAFEGDHGTELGEVISAEEGKRHLALGESPPEARCLLCGRDKLELLGSAQGRLCNSCGRQRSRIKKATNGLSEGVCPRCVVMLVNTQPGAAGGSNMGGRAARYACPICNWDPLTSCKEC